MTNPCTCKAEHWQPHADSCPQANQNKPSVVTNEQFPTYEQLAEGWKQMQAERDHLRGNLSLAEEGLASAMQEIKELTVDRDLWREQAASVHLV
jgi:hypothetical protein